METSVTAEALKDKKNKIKEALRRLKGNESPEEMERLKREFQELVEDANPLLIAMAEQDLLSEGMEFSDLKNACTAHLELFGGMLEKHEVAAPEGHPVKTFQMEHRAILKLMNAFRDSVHAAGEKGSAEAAGAEIDRVRELANRLLEAENHNVRQENTLFPILERHGVTAPPAVMWEEHTEMKEMKKAILKEIGRLNERPFAEWIDRLDTMARVLTEHFFAHSQKENHILYQTALSVITPEEWKDIAEECDHLGYFSLEGFSEEQK